MRSLDIFDEPQKFTGGRCRVLRRRWDIHVHHLADAARVDRDILKRWEAGRWFKKAPPEWVASVHIALRSLVIEAAFVLVMQLAGPTDSRLVGFRLLAKGRKRDGAGHFETTSRVVLA